VAELLLPWAEHRNLDMQLTLLDIHPHTCAVARDRNRANSRVGVVQGDIYQLGVQQVDIVIASLFLHHIPTRQLASVLDSLQRAARLGVVINDLHRHWLAWAFIKTATRLFSGNRLIRHDAPLSVRRGFRAGDLERLKNKAGLKHLTYYRRPFFRYLIVLPTTNGDKL
jgi:SAM-dependent methyltransferase